ncbi:MAG TPA: hypothetical protein VIL34_17690 [Actinopolymorphaceae bacterium]
MAGVHDIVTGIADQARGMGLFAEPVPIADSASLLDRALARSGRDPRWSRAKP